MAKRVDGAVTPLGEPQTFESVPLGTATLAAEDKAALLEFQQKTARLQRAVKGSVKAGEETQIRLDHIKKAVNDTPAADSVLLDEAGELEARLKDLQTELSGDETVSSRSEPTSPSIVNRVQTIVRTQWSSTSGPTQTSRDAYEIAGNEFSRVLEKLRNLIEVDLTALEEKLEAAGAPWTPGRLPRWEPE